MAHRNFKEAIITPHIYIYIYLKWNCILRSRYKWNCILRSRSEIVYYAPDTFCWALQIHSVEHSYGLGGESLRETFTICIMHRSLLAVWALWWLHNAILQCVTVHRVPKFTSCHNAIMVVTGRAHCSILLYIYIYLSGFSKRCSLKLRKKTSFCHRKP